MSYEGRVGAACSRTLLPMPERAATGRTYSCRGDFFITRDSMLIEGVVTMADEQQVCPNCGNFNRAGARFCSKCGHVFKPSAVAASPSTPASAPTPPASPATPASSAGAMLCPNCGKEVSADTRFCRHCGHPLGATQPAAASPASVAAPVPASRVTPAPVAPGVNAAKSVVTSDDDMTQPLGVKTKSPAPAAPAKAAPTPSMRAERGAPAWLWALVGLLIGILFGAGIVLAAPGFVGLERIAAPEATPDAAAPGSPAVTETATPLELPTATTEIVATATPEPPPAATATAAPATETISAPAAAPDEAEASPTIATDPTAAAPPDETEAPPADTPTAAAESATVESATTPADDATAETSPTSTPLAP